MNPSPKSWRRRLGLFVKSIRFRLTLLNVAILAVILVAFSVFVYTRQAQVLQIQAQSQLSAKTQQLEGMYRMSFSDSDHEHFQPPDLSSRGASLIAENMVLIVVGADGKIVQNVGEIDASITDPLIKDWQPLLSAAPQVFHNVSYQVSAGASGRTEYLFVVAPIFVERAQVGMILVGRPLDPDGQLPALGVTLLFGSLATLLLAVAGGYWQAGRAMAPVRTITRAARTISESDLHRRLHLGAQDELGELADTFDEMLDRLQAAFDRQRQFTADASHELRTPLTIIGLEAEQALGRRRTSGEYERALKIIQSENEFMGSLVNDLLTLARMDAGQTPVKFEALDLGELCADVTVRLAGLAGRSGVQLTTGELPEAPVQGDRRLVIQLLTNLVQNAIQYAGGAGHHVQLESGVRPDPLRPVAWVQIVDDGPGIPPEHLPHLFERFYRIDQARARAEDENGAPQKGADGSGLGLSIVQWIATAHGGQVTVTSQVGKGAVFEVQFPVSKN
jgi:signal transduction histidine kinase